MEPGRRLGSGSVGRAGPNDTVCAQLRQLKDLARVEERVAGEPQHGAGREPVTYPHSLRQRRFA
jgi:hypothetical protein